MSNVIPFNNRILIKEINEEQEVREGAIFVPKYLTEKKTVEKFIHATILAVAPEIEARGVNIVGKECIVETGMIEEVVFDNQKYTFVPLAYVVCVVDKPSILGGKDLL